MKYFPIILTGIIIFFCSCTFVNIFFKTECFLYYLSFNTNKFFSLDYFKWNYCLSKINFTAENDVEIRFENEMYFRKRCRTCSFQLFKIIDIVDWISSCFRCNSNMATSSTWYCRQKSTLDFPVSLVHFTHSKNTIQNS